MTKNTIPFACAMQDLCRRQTEIHKTQTQEIKENKEGKGKDKGEDKSESYPVLGPARLSRRNSCVPTSHFARQGTCEAIFAAQLEYFV